MTEAIVEEEVRILEEQIQSIQDQLDRPEQIDTSSVIHHLGTEIFRDRPAYQKHISLTKQVEVTQAITGVNITDIQRSSTDSTEVLRGSIGDVDFTIKYRVHFSQDEETDPCLKDLKVLLTQNQPKHVQNFIQKCEESCNLLGFFQAFSAYSTWCGHRSKTFTHYKHKHPRLIDIRQTEEGEMLQVKTHSAVYSILWCHMITDQLTSVPIIQLYVDTKCSGPVQESLPEKFQELLSKHGIETAIDTLLEGIL